MPERDLLSLWEEVYLLAIWELRGEAYGVAIKKLVSQKTGHILSYGGLYFTLAQLAKKGLVVKTEGEPSPWQGGRRKYFYTLTERGKKALRTSIEFQRSLWRDVKEPVKAELLRTLPVDLGYGRRHAGRLSLVATICRMAESHFLTL